MNLEQPLFPKQHIQQVPGDLSLDFDAGELKGQAFQVNIQSGLVRDLARMFELEDKPDLEVATFFVDNVVECLELTTVADLGSAEDVAWLLGAFKDFTEDETLAQTKKELVANGRGGLVEQLENFVDACREFFAKLGEFASASDDSASDADPEHRFNLLQPTLAKIIDAHREFYLKFREM